MEDEVSGLSADPMLSSQGFVDVGMENTLMEQRRGLCCSTAVAMATTVYD